MNSPPVAGELGDSGPLTPSGLLVPFAPISYLDRYNIRSIVVVNPTAAVYQVRVWMDCGT